ncbi:U-box domain-containing protein 9 [Amaranthus tricolor]|uniref:U-box domain-containing protein 9 n=1 Tax=Amaranthus tricolor TaxID=29722 RepID=UPI0025894018|nr:U-box domain-containing protein 9 [Amaranthus tricolor]
MAKTGVVSEGDSIRLLELKKELRLLVKAILEEEDGSNSNSSSSTFVVDAIDKAKDILSTLKDVKWKKTASLRLDDASFSCPPEFRCPLSKQLMQDPVIISTGQTYDRPFIQKWLKAGHRICPITQQVLSHSLLTPNYLIREMIAQWCESRGIENPDPVGYVNEEGVTEADRDYFSSLIDKMSKSIGEQKAAAKELRLLTKRMPSFRALFGESTEAIPHLLEPLTRRRRGSLSSGCHDLHPDLQEDLITTLLNISIHDSNKKLVAETPMVITLLIDALQCGTPETRSNAAAALFTLSALDSNKVLIGKSGALKPLINLLEEGHPMGVKDAASAIFNLCIKPENKAIAVREKAVRVILKKIKNGVHVDELLAILAMLSTHQRAVDELAELDAVPCLLKIMRESSCSRNKENCIATLYTICINHRTKLRELREEERTYSTLSQLAQDGTSRAKRKANGILERLNRAMNLTHTA